MLSALGMSRATLAALSVARLAMVTTAGGVLAVVIAVAASPLMPIGPARLAGVALLIGVPLGLLAGRWAWGLFASSAGLAPAGSIPVALVLLIIPATVALAALIAAGPGRAAARVRAAVVLRAE